MYRPKSVAASVKVSVMEQPLTRPGAMQTKLTGLIFGPIMSAWAKEVLFRSKCTLSLDRD